MEADRMDRSNRVTLDALIAEATVDCHNDSERATGFYTVLDDNLAMPFQTVVLGVDVTVAGIDLTDGDHIMTVCTRGRSTQRIPILDLPLPAPPPDGAEWIAAYRRWVGRA
jgi:Calcium binding